MKKIVALLICAVFVFGLAGFAVAYTTVVVIPERLSALTDVQVADTAIQEMVRVALALKIVDRLLQIDKITADKTTPMKATAPVLDTGASFALSKDGLIEGYAKILGPHMLAAMVHDGMDMAKMALSDMTKTAYTKGKTGIAWIRGESVTAYGKTKDMGIATIISARSQRSGLAFYDTMAASQAMTVN